MMFIRPILQGDGDALEHLAKMSGLGLTHLPTKRELLDRKIADSLNAFSRQSSVFKEENYVFVLEDSPSGKVVGTCAISSKMGLDCPSHLFKIEPDFSSASPHLPASLERRVLHVGFHQNGYSEICALYLLPEFRNGGIGKLLSLCRFLFIAAHRTRFQHVILAEMRGFINEDKTCPFWTGLGRHFFDVSFEKVMEMRVLDPSFIPEILPKHPIYVTFLSKETQEMIGKVHPRTEPAIKMLKNQGFEFINEIDFFDGGPDIAAKTEEIKAIKESIVGYVDGIVETSSEGKQCLMSNERLDFRACVSTLIAQEDHSVRISAEAASTLQVKKGDPIRYLL